MSIGAEVASHLPFLRRYARALTGSQSTGDAFVRATLEAALADSDLAESLRGGRVPLYRAFNKVWSSAYLEVADERAGQGLHESAAQDQLRKITPINRQALLLTTVEDFSPAEAGTIMDIREDDVGRLVQEAVDDILAIDSVPVIFITAYPERLLTGDRPEPTYLITKPFQEDTVRAAISQALFFGSSRPLN